MERGELYLAIWDALRVGDETTARERSKDLAKFSGADSEVILSVIRRDMADADAGRASPL